MFKRVKNYFITFLLIAGLLSSPASAFYINRSIESYYNNSQELVKDELTGGLDGGITVDLRLLDPTGAGQKQIFDELTKLPENLVKNAQFGTQAAVTLGTIAADAVGTVVSGASADERGVFGEIKDKTGIALAETEFAKHNAKADEVLKNPALHTAQEIAEAEQIRDAYYKRYGVSAEEYQAVVYAKADDKRHGGYVSEDKVGGVNLIDGSGKVIDGQTMKEAGVHESVHGLGYGEEYALSLGEYAAARNGLFTVFGADYGGEKVEASDWLTGTNESYLWDINEYYTKNDASTTQNWMDGPNTGFIKDFDGNWSTHNELRQQHPEIVEAENRVALSAGLIGGGIMLSPVATAALGPTVGGLVVNGVGLALSIPVVQDGADALGTWAGSENLSAEEKWALGARIGFGALGALSAPVAGVNIAKTGISLVKANGAVSALPDAYQGIKEASAYLKTIGIPRNSRVQILQSFNPQNMFVKIADDATYGLRFYKLGTNPAGRYLFPTFTNNTNRAGLAIIPEFNNPMTGIQQFQIRRGSIYIQGTAAPQGFYPGGGVQIFTDKSNLIKL